MYASLLTTTEQFKILQSLADGEVHRVADVLGIPDSGSFGIPDEAAAGYETLRTLEARGLLTRHHNTGHGDVRLTTIGRRMCRDAKHPGPMTVPEVLRELSQTPRFDG